MRALLLVVMVMPAAARADPCRARPDLVSGPAQVGLADGESAVARRVCPATEIGMGGTGVLLVDEPNFFGQVRAAGQLWGSWAWNEQTESFVALEVVRYQTVISSFTASDLGFGHTTLGSTVRFLVADDWSAAAWGRLVLPTAFTLYGHAWPITVDLGTSAELRLSSALVAHGSLSGSFTAALSRGPAQPRLGIDASLGGGWQPVSWWALVLDITTESGRTAPLDHAAARLALRFRIVGHWDVSLAALAPFAGRERAQVAGALRVSWRP